MKSLVGLQPLGVLASSLINTLELTQSHNKALLGFAPAPPKIYTKIKDGDYNSMNEITDILMCVICGSLLSTLLFHILVDGFDWSLNKAVWVAPFAFVIVPFFCFIALPLILLGEVMRGIYRLFDKSGRNRQRYRRI